MIDIALLLQIMQSAQGQIDRLRTRVADLEAHSLENQTRLTSAYSTIELMAVEQRRLHQLLSDDAARATKH